MSDITDLKLINAVDPTKIKVAINEKFSKLTLSSNKKKNNEEAKLADPQEIVKRQSASRNLIEELVTNAQENEDQVKYSNPILQTSSSSELTETLTQLDNVHDESKNMTTQSSMERLQLQISAEYELDDLAQKVSNLTVDEKCNVMKYEQTFLNETEIIVLDSDEGSVEASDEEDSVICLSDSEEENLPPGPEDEYNLMQTSDIVKSGQTGEPQLPCTLSNVRADRIEDFLRDVSQECRNIAATGGGLAEDSFLVHLPTPTENNENVLKNSFKAKQIATADTESMKTHTDSMRPSTDSRKLEAIALNDTEAISESAEVTLFSQKWKDFNDNASEQLLAGQELAAKRLANDDTEVNTTFESANESMQAKEKSIAQENESIDISETSCEESNASKTCLSKSTPTIDHDIITSEEALSNSIKQSNDTYTETPIGINIGSINISAKINIKVQIHASFSSSDENNANGDSSDSSGNSNGQNESAGDYKETDSNKDDESNVNHETKLEYIAKENQAFQIDKRTELCITPKPNDKNNVMSNAEKLLTELYGQSWRTPDIVKSLKRTERTTNVNKASNKIFNSKTLEQTMAVAPKKVDKSQGLDDFSIFRLNIEKTNMDSTRLITPKPKNATKKRSPLKMSTEPRRKQESSKKVFQSVFKAPQTEFKKKPAKIVNERWRQLIDSDSGPEENNASDDDHIEKTILTDDESNTESDEENVSNASDSSWQILTEDEDTDQNDDDENDNGKNMTKSPAKTKTKSQTKTKNARKERPKDHLIYMDLSKNEVSIVERLDSPPANHDENFQKHLSAILDSCRHEERPKLEATPKSNVKTKRRLFNVNFGYEDTIDDNDNLNVEKALKEINLNTDKRSDDAVDDDSILVRYKGVLIPPSFNIFNKPVEAVKVGKPVYKITPPRSKEPQTPKTPINKRQESTPFKKPQVFATPTVKDKRKLNELCSTPAFKYSFLKSLDVCVGKSMCHPDALVFRENFRQKKEDLAKILYELYNSKLFDNKLNVPLQWNKKLLNTAGRCLNKKKAGQRLSVIELSEKVLTSGDRLRCTLIHEMCHAATWVFNGEGGHGATWKQWARKANEVFTDLPKIGVCHQYDIEYKYTYKCTLCAAKSYYHSKSKKVENIRCSYCYGAIEIFLNKKDKEGNIMPTPVKEPKGFAKFVKEKYQQYKRPEMKHAEVMKLLSNEYAALKISNNAK